MHIPYAQPTKQLPTPYRSHDGTQLYTILYRYPFYHSTLEFWLRSQCQEIIPSTYKYVLLLFFLISKQWGVICRQLSLCAPLFCQGVLAMGVSFFLACRAFSPSLRRAHFHSSIRLSCFSLSCLLCLCLC